MDGRHPKVQRNGGLMKRYADILLAFFKASVVAELEFRLNLVIKVLIDLIWYLTQLALFSVLFSHTKTISGWTLESTRVFMGMLFASDALYMMFFSENLDHMTEKVRRGDLDLLLVKPINSQFMLSCQKLNPVYLLNFIFSVVWIVWAAGELPQAVSWTRFLFLFIAIPCSVAITYSIRFFFAAAAILFVRAENVSYIWHQLYRLGTRPDTIYPNWLRFAVLSFLPVAFIASVPARLLLSTADFPDWQSFGLLSGSVFVATTCVYFSSRYWRHVLKFYASASS
jgi:ABC-2 type transport system permease protein